MAASSSADATNGEASTVASDEVAMTFVKLRLLTTMLFSSFAIAKAESDNGLADDAACRQDVNAAHGDETASAAKIQGRSFLVMVMLLEL